MSRTHPPRGIVEYKSTLLFDKTLQGRAYVSTRPTQQDVLNLSREYLDIINCKKMNKKMKQSVMQKTVENIHNYFNKGYLEYRKSVTEAGDYAAIEWSGIKVGMIHCPPPA